MTIVQTFITAPMTVERLKQNFIIAALSLAYAHNAGYKVKMYTDSLGLVLLSRLPYDEINTEMDGIKLPTKNALWSIGKYYALMKEPLGTIHTDFDVMLRKPCLDGLLDGYDATCQIKEHIENTQTWYEDCRKFLLKHGCQRYMNLTRVIYTYNVGIIGYGTEKMRKKHAGAIIDIYNKFKDYNGEMPTIDFYIEQANLYNLTKRGFKVNPIIKDAVFFDDNYRIINEYADTIGYCHLQSWDKYKPDVFARVLSNLQKENKEIYDSISDIINITK